jgi:hypothetical protein
MIPRHDFVKLVSDLAKEVASEKEWAFSYQDTDALFDIIASSMVELHYGDQSGYENDSPAISLLATAVFLSVENAMLYKLLLDKNDEF